MQCIRNIHWRYPKTDLRIPVRSSFSARYGQLMFWGLPKDGYWNVLESSLLPLVLRFALIFPCIPGNLPLCVKQESTHSLKGRYRWLRRLPVTVWWRSDRKLLSTMLSAPVHPPSVSRRTSQSGFQCSRFFRFSKGFGCIKVERILSFQLQ